MAWHFKSWGKSKTERLRNLWWDGVSAVDIAVELGAAHARAVKDKVAREGFERSQDYLVRQEQAKLAKELAGKEPSPLLRDGETITFMNMKAGECRWINGEPSADVQVCGHPVEGLSAYCEHHQGRVRVKGSGT